MAIHPDRGQVLDAAASGLLYDGAGEGCPTGPEVAGTRRPGRLFTRRSRCRPRWGGGISQLPLPRRIPMRKAKLLSLALGSALLFTATLATAQTPAPPPPAYGLPITLDQAKKVMAGAEAEAKKNNWPVAIVILDSGGQIVMMQRLDNTQWGSVRHRQGEGPLRRRAAAPDQGPARRHRPGRRQPPLPEHRLQRARGRHPDHRRRQDHRLHRRLRRHVQPGRSDRPGGHRQSEVVGGTERSGEGRGAPHIPLSARVCARVSVWVSAETRSVAKRASAETSRWCDSATSSG